MLSSFSCQNYPRAITHGYSLKQINNYHNAPIICTSQLHYFNNQCASLHTCCRAVLNMIYWELKKYSYLLRPMCLCLRNNKSESNAGLHMYNIDMNTNASYIETVEKTWWRHQMETFSAWLAICAGNSPVPGEFPTQRPVTRSFDVFFDLHLNKRLSKQSWGWWFEALSCPFWRHRYEYRPISGITKFHPKYTDIWTQS